MVILLVVICFCKKQKTAPKFNVPEGFPFSSGWLHRFKQRAGISQHKIHGESTSASETLVAEGRKELQALLAQYSPEDTYNMDETGLFFKLEPTSTLASAPVKGKKKARSA